MSQGVFNNGGMAGMPPPPNFGVAWPQNLFQPNGQVMNPMQYNQVFQNPAYQQQPTYQPQVAGLVQQLLQALQPNNNPANYNYQTQQNNVPVFDPRDAYARGRGNPHGGSQSFDSESNRGGGDGSSFAEFMRGDPESELDGDGVNRGRGRGRDSDRERVYDHDRGDTQRTVDQLSDNEYDYNPPRFEDYDVPNSQDSKAVSDSKDQP